MIAWMAAVAICLAMTGAGWWWAVVATPVRPTPLARLGLAYLIGSAFVTLGMLMAALAGLAVTRLTVLACIGITAASGWFGTSRAGATSRAPEPGVETFARLIVGLVIVALAIGTAFAFLLGPVEHVDFLRAWGLKGRAVFVHHSLDFDGVDRRFRFYPLEISNLYAAVYLLAGTANDTVVRLPLAMFGCATAAVMWWLMRLMLPPLAAAVGLGLAVLTPTFVMSMTVGLADLAVAAYVTLVALTAYLWIRDGTQSWAMLCGIGAGAAGWTKFDGIPTALIVVLGVLVAMRTFRPPGLPTWVFWFLLFVVPWQVYQRIHHIAPARAHFHQIYLDIPWIGAHVSTGLLGITQWGVFWPLTIGTIICTAPLWWYTRYRSLALVTLPNVVLTAAAYVTQHRAGQSETVTATVHRLYLHIEPSVAAMAAAAAYEAFEYARNSPPRQPTAD